jgi:hypothetical protein
VRILLFIMILALFGCGAATPDERASAGPPPAASASEPLFRGHSHNDYTRARPLLDALELGFGSVEADVFLVDGELLVAHDRERCRPGRTLDALYLQPLIERARANGGRIYPGFDEPLVLLVDIKADGEGCYAALHERLLTAPDVFTECDRGVVFPRAVTVVISGQTPRSTMAGQSRRLAFVDGRVGDLEAPVAEAPGAALVPLVSMAWSSQFKWQGLGEMPSQERGRLAELVGAAHERGYRVRFWGVPGLDHVWRELYGAGVDLINVDDLARAAGVLREAGR